MKDAVKAIKCENVANFTSGFEYAFEILHRVSLLSIFIGIFVLYRSVYPPRDSTASTLLFNRYFFVVLSFSVSNSNDTVQSIKPRKPM